VAVCLTIFTHLLCWQSRQSRWL